MEKVRELLKTGTHSDWYELRDQIVSIFNEIPIQSALEYHQMDLLSVINHSPDEVVDLIATHYIEPNLTKIEDILKHTALAVTIALSRRLPGEECYEALARILWKFIEVKEVTRELEEQLKNTSSSLRFHVHHVTSLCLKNKPADNGAALRLLVTAVVKELDSPDILSCQAAMELLCDAASDFAENAQLFRQMGLTDKIYGLMQTSRNEPEGGFLYPVCLRFFAHLSTSDPASLENYPIFVASVLDMVNHFDLLDAPQRALAFETLTVISSTSRAKKILSESANYNMDKAMNHFGAACASGPMELRIRALDALTMMYDSKSQTPIDAEILGKWYILLGEPFTELLISYLKKPFVDLRIATLHLINALMKYEWAIKIFFNAQSFSDYLVDPNIEPSSIGNQLKNDIVSVITASNSPAIDSITRLRLRNMIGRRENFTEPATL